MSNQPDAYMLDDAGKLHRKGEHIASLNEKHELEWVKPEFKKYAAPVASWLAKKAKEEESADNPDQPGAVEVPVEVVPPALPVLSEAQKEAQSLKGVEAEAERQKAKAEAASLDDRAFAERTGCPPPPKKNPQFGDKTPAYVEWLKEHRPGVFKERFGVQRRGKVPVIEQDADGIEQVAGYRDADMATRKTHLTEKVETDKGLGDDMSWDA